MGARDPKLKSLLELGRGPVGESKEPRVTKWGPLMSSVGPTEGETEQGAAAAVGSAALFEGVWGPHKKSQKYNDCGFLKPS